MGFTNDQASEDYVNNLFVHIAGNWPDFIHFIWFDDNNNEIICADFP